MFYEQLRTIFKDNKFVAGSIAGCGSVIVTYPFDIIRVRLAFETSTGLESSGIRGICKRIYHEPGPWKGQEKGRIWNFYRGLWPSLLGMIPYAGVSFYSYEKGKEVMSQWEWCLKEPRDGMVAVQLDKNENGTHSLNHSSNLKVKINDGALLVAGGISGMMAQTVSYPFEVIRRHMQVSSVIPNIPSKTITSTSTTSTTGAQVLGKSGSSESAKGMIKTARDIVKARGLNGLFVGLGIGYLKVCYYNLVYTVHIYSLFILYEFIWKTMTDKFLYRLYQCLQYLFILMNKQS
jgi:solute carrier family 25 protein 16